MSDWKKFTASLDEFENMRAHLNAAADSARIEPAIMSKLELGFEEAVVNIINYSGSEHIYLKISSDADLFTVEIVDCGTPFNPLTVDDPRAYDTAALEERMPGGFGIFLIKKTFDELSYAFEEFNQRPANHISMSLRLNHDET